MIRAGLTGGYASGKSLAAAEFARLGCHVIYADELGHRVLEPDGEAFRPVVERFGAGILGRDGKIDRKLLATLVFDSPEDLAGLTSIVHPAVYEREEQLTRAFAVEDPHGIVVYEAAILIETGRHKMYDRLILTVTDQETQIARGMKRDHATREEALARIGRQLPLEEKRKYADYEVDTSRGKKETIAQVLAIYEDLKRLAGQCGGA